jgi:hypothetical protein
MESSQLDIPKEEVKKTPPAKQKEYQFGERVPTPTSPRRKVPQYGRGTINVLFLDIDGVVLLEGTNLCDIV